MRLSLAVATVLVLGLSVQDVCAASPKVPQQMQELGFLVGTWHGSGVIQSAGGAHVTCAAALDVQPVFDGSVLILRMSSPSDSAGTMPPCSPDIALLRVVSFDRFSKRYLVRSFSPDGFTTDWESELNGDTLTCWVDDVRAGRTRFRISPAPEGGLIERADILPVVHAEGEHPWRELYEFDLTRQ